MALEMLHVLENIYENRLGESRISEHYLALQEGIQSKRYQPLMTRTKCSMLFRCFLFSKKKTKF